MGRLSALLITLLVAGCASPTSRLHALADSQGFERSSVVAVGYRHTVFSNERALAPSDEQADDTGVAQALDRHRGDVLHVYLEGDGSPWRHRTIIMPDPTPRSPLMLRLMALDSNPAVYVGRPCYNGAATEPGCDNRLWTSDRYSEIVVASMAGVLRVIAERRGNPELRLIGHSGGGALALLLAERLDDVRDVVTVAGNLDIDAWTSHHGYTPLYGSLNPARRPPLQDSTAQWHLVADLDAVVPPLLVRGFIVSQASATGVSVDGFTHGCCWARIWPDILSAVADGQADALPGTVFKRPGDTSLGRSGAVQSSP